MNHSDTPAADRRDAERRQLLERLNRARDEITSLEQALARLPETAPHGAAQHTTDTPLPIAAG